MSCIHHHPSEKHIPQIGGHPIVMPVHRCNILGRSMEAGMQVQQVLMPLGLCGSIIPTQCPIATHHSDAWEKCPLYEAE